MLMFIFLFIIIAIVAKLLLPKKKVSIKGKHVVIFGGSSGIGKALAILAAKEGAHVTILARNIDTLIEAKNEIKSYCTDEEQIITKVSVDVVNYEAVENNLGEVEEIVGPIYMLVNCAGMAICGEIENFTQQEIKNLVDVNLIGSVYSVKAIVPKFKKRREGIIVLTASQVALMGMYGYSVYSSCKFALRGLAESVYMEVKPYNISVTLALPPDTDTPGFEAENKTKPKETKLLAETGGLVKPEEVAKRMLNDALVIIFTFNINNRIISIFSCSIEFTSNRVLYYYIENLNLSLLKNGLDCFYYFDFTFNYQKLYISCSL
nr:unnamed protein product [Callosobruchus chinensis]